MPFIRVILNVKDHKKKSGTFAVNVNIENGGLEAIPQVVKYVSHVVSKLVNCNLVRAYALVDVSAGAVWALGQTVGEGEQAALAAIQEKAVFTFYTPLDAQGKQYPMTVTIPSVDDTKVFVNGSTVIDQADTDVAEFIDMFENGEVDLSNANYGGAVSDAFSVVDSRYMDILGFGSGDYSWGN